LFVGVKLVELIYHMSPRRLWRILATPDSRMRKQLHHCVWHISSVFWYEVFEAIAARLRPRLARQSVTELHLGPDLRRTTPAPLSQL
jgi:hypothetical protein